MYPFPSPRRLLGRRAADRQRIGGRAAATSGVVIAKALLEGWPAAAVAAPLTDAFRGVTPPQATADVEQVRRIIAELDSPGDNYPILNLADPSFTPKATPLDGPLSADVPLAQPERLLPILDRLWELAIPHVTLIAGEHPDAAALVRAVERAEDLGLIAGVRGRGTDLTQGSLIHDLAQAGVDHVDVSTFRPSRGACGLAGSGDHAKAVEALAEVRRNEVCPVAEVPLLEATLGGIDATLGSLATAGVSNVCFWAIAAAPDGGSHQSPQPLGGMLLADDLVEAAGWSKNRPSSRVCDSVVSADAVSAGGPVGGPGLAARGAAAIRPCGSNPTAA